MEGYLCNRGYCDQLRPSIHLLIHLSIHSSIPPSTTHPSSIYWFIHRSLIHPSIYWSIYQSSIHLFNNHPSIHHPSIHPFIIHPFTHPSSTHRHTWHFSRCPYLQPPASASGSLPGWSYRKHITQDPSQSDSCWCLYSCWVTELLSLCLRGRGASEEAFCVLYPRSYPFDLQLGSLVSPWCSDLSSPQQTIKPINLAIITFTLPPLVSKTSWDTWTDQTEAAAHSQ